MNLRSILKLIFLNLLILNIFLSGNAEATYEQNRTTKANGLMGYGKNRWDWMPSGSGLKNKSAIIALHGYGDCADEQYVTNFAQLKDAKIFVPDMPYSTRLLAKRAGIVSMGGSADIIALALCVDRVRKLGYENIGLYGFSCGGATIANLVYTLQNPEKHKKIFDELEINPTELLKYIKVCFLDRPFASFDHTVEAIAGKTIAAWAKKMGTRKTMQSIVKIHRMGNKVNFDGLEPLNSVESIKDMPVFVHLSQKDRVVGCEGPLSLYEKLKNNNSENVQLVQTSIKHKTMPLPAATKAEMVSFARRWL